MGKVRWTAEAERWLREIHDYIARDNPAAAQRTVRKIFDKAEVLAEFPRIGYVYEPDEAEPVRVLLYGHYRIVYRLRSGDDLEIIGVFHGALDMDRYL